MEEIILGLKVDTSGSQLPIAELEASLKKMKDDIKTLPSDSQAFKVLQTEIKKADAELKNVNKSLEGLSKEKLSESLGKLVGGTTAAVAGFGLLIQTMGGTKEAAQQMQESFNVAFGVISGVKGLVEAFTGLGALLPVVTNAMAAFNAVVKANPIGLAITALTLAAGALIVYSNSTEEATSKQEDFNTSLEQAASTAEKYKTQINEIARQMDGLVSLLVQSGDLSKNTSGLISGVLANLLKDNKELFDAFSSEIESSENKIKDALQKRVAELSKNSADTSAEVEKLYTKLTFLKKILFETKGEEQLDIAKRLGKSLSELRAEYNATGNKITELLDSNNQVNVKDDEIVKELTEQLKYIQELKKNGLKTDQERTAELEKQKKKQQEIYDEITKFEFIRRENAIRSAQEGIDIEERNKVELLKREEQYQNDLTALKRNEVLTTKQKNDAQKVLEQQYALDKIDINQKYLDEKAAADKKAAEDSQKLQDDLFAYNEDIKKRQLLSTAEYNLLVAQKNKTGVLEAQKNLLKAKRDAELMNTELTASEKQLILEKYAAKERELTDATIKQEKEKRAQLISDLSNLLSNAYSVYASMREGDTAQFEAQQTKQLDIFDQTQQQKQIVATESGENAKAIEQSLAAEREQFLADQANEANKRKKADAKNELALQLVTAIASMATAIIKAQENKFPLSIEEAIRIAALGATQIATINAQINKINAIETYGDGGVINGPSHANGGVKFAVGGQVNELEGGEGVINKRSMAMPGVAQAASFLNQLGGGVAFNNSVSHGNGLSAMISSGAFAGSMQQEMIVKAYVVEKEITDAQQINNRIRNKAKF